jgi:hypothetical protein
MATPQDKGKPKPKPTSPSPPPQPAASNAAKSNSGGAPKWLEYSQVGNMATNWVFGNLGYVFFIFFILLIYVANALNAERKIRQVQTLEKEIKELRWKYMSVKADLMLEAKQSEVLKAVEPLGLNTNNARRKRIVVSE